MRSRLRAALPDEDVRRLDAGSLDEARTARVLVASDFAGDTLVRQPDLLPRLLNDSAVEISPPVLEDNNRADWPALLRRYRQAESTRLVWRDVLGLDDLQATLDGTTRLAETCLQVALQALEVEFEQRHGLLRPRDESGQVGAECG